jgi:membrane-associated protein
MVIADLLNYLLHLDKHLQFILTEYGLWTYLILFLIIFCETGLVVTPFLPGDSLLFAVGSFAALGLLKLEWLFVMLVAAAIVGDTINYHIGSYVGPRAFSGHFRLLKKEHLTRTHRFFKKYGGKTIILARFIPIIRTFAPFVAGVGSMTYPRFLTYNVIGGVAWVTLFLLGGYFFGSLPFVRDNFTIVVLAIIGISLLPPVIEVMNNRFAKRSPAGR